MVVETGKDAEGAGTMESGKDRGCNLKAELNTYIVKLFKLVDTKEIDHDKMEWRMDA